MDGNTKVVGLIGWPISHSYSPAMHNAAAEALGLNLIYVPLPVPPDRLFDALRGLPALGIRGVNVTVPYKQAVLPHLDAIYPAAQVIGAANTIVVGDGLLTGFNTDWSGFLVDLESYRLALYGRDCLVMGAGGSARAVVYALLWRGCRVTVASRRLEQAQQLATELSKAFPEAAPVTAIAMDEMTAAAEHLDAPIIVNTTPLGMLGDGVALSPWPEGTPFPAGTFVYDLVYNPSPTRLVAQARAAGLRAANGLGMLVRQAAEAFEVLTGRRPDVEVMRQAIPQEG
ncbi:MAG: shikimate dehydrogenase [Anaerolineae bacterium]|nr:shikimate dehydrogenase [Anaerolineae bacterium]